MDNVQTIVLRLKRFTKRDFTPCRIKPVCEIWYSVISFDVGAANQIRPFVQCFSKHKLTVQRKELGTIMRPRITQTFRGIDLSIVGVTTCCGENYDRKRSEALV